MESISRLLDSQPPLEVNPFINGHDIGEPGFLQEYHVAVFREWFKDTLETSLLVNNLFGGKGIVQLEFRINLSHIVLEPCIGCPDFFKE